MESVFGSQEKKAVSHTSRVVELLSGTTSQMSKAGEVLNAGSSEETAASASEAVAAMDEEEFEEVIRGRELQEVIWDASSGKLGVLRRALMHGDFHMEMLEAVEPDSGGKPLHIAAQAGSEPAVRTLLNAGADPNGRTSEAKCCRAALHVAAAAGHWQCCRALASKGARAEARTTDGRTALHFACEAGSEPTVKELLRAARRAIEARDDDGRSPLHSACAAASSACVRALVTSGADKFAKDAFGRTPLDVVLLAPASRDRKRMERLLAPTDLLNEEEEEDDEVDEETLRWCWLLVDISGKMVETKDRKVAVFDSAAAASRWAAALPDGNDGPANKGPAFASQQQLRVPARIARIEAFVAEVPSQRVQDPAESEDAIMLEFQRRTQQNKEKGVEADHTAVLDELRDAEKALADARASADEAAAQVDAREATLLTVFASCQRLEAAIKQHEAALKKAPRGADLLATARALADAHHPAARDDADPARFAAACAALVDTDPNQFRRPPPQQVVHQPQPQRPRVVSPPPRLVSPPRHHEVVADPPLEDRRPHFVADPPLEDRRPHFVANPPVEDRRPHFVAARPLEDRRSQLVADRPLEDRRPHDRPVENRGRPQLAPETKEPPPDDEDDDDDEEDLALLQELETELAAAGVKKHAKAARRLHAEELTWGQLRTVFSLSGPDGLRRNLAPLGLTAGALTAIENHLASLEKQQAAAAVPADPEPSPEPPSSSDEEDNTKH